MAFQCVSMTVSVRSPSSRTAYQSDGENSATRIGWFRKSV